MPRVRQRETNRGLHSISTYEQAYKDVVNLNLSIREAAKNYDLCHVSLMRYKSKREQSKGNGEIAMGYKSHKRVFDSSLEKTLKGYLFKFADLCHGITRKEIRRLAYEMSLKYGLKRPPTWDVNKLAGTEWVAMFLLKHRDIKARCTEEKSLSKAIAFSKKNCEKFFDNLAEISSKHKFEDKDVYNVDEIGVTTAENPDRVISKRNADKFGSILPVEKHTLVTVTIAVNAVGNYIPPMFIFPRKQYQEHFIDGGPSGCIGAANLNLWMQANEFLLFLKHLKKHSNASVDKEILLLLDVNRSSINLKVLNFCKKNGIVLLPFPPQTLYKLQPINRKVYAPLKKHVKSACESWIRSNPNEMMTIYDIPGIIETSLPLAATQANIRSGFKYTGIFSFCRKIFTNRISTENPSTSMLLPKNTEASSAKTVVAKARKAGKRNTKIKIALCTDTLQKEVMQNEYLEKEIEKFKKNLSKEITTGLKEKDSEEAVQSIDDDDEEYYILVV